MFDFVYIISYRDVNNLDAKLFLYTFVPDDVLSEDWLNIYYCFRPSSNITYLVPLNFMSLGQIY